jgi:tetratricopeptide (TPR) repeat protein
LVRLLPELAAGPIEPLPSWTLSPEQERRLMFAAVRRFLANVAGAAGTLLALDDLQWAGADALSLLVSLARAGASVPLRLFGAYRHTESHPPHPLAAAIAELAQAELATHLTLGPLSGVEAACLLDAVLEQDGQHDEPDVPPPVRARALQRAGGVPFFVVSCARGLSAADGDYSGSAVPWNVLQSVRQQCATLPDMGEEILQVAAVAGRAVPRTLLAAVLRRSEAGLLGGLRAVCTAQLLEEDGPFAYRFAHDIVREVVEADLGAARRVLLHRDIAAALVALCASEPGDLPIEEIAYHYGATQEHAQAASWLERAGDHAAARFASAAALEHYTLASGHAQACGAGTAALSRLDEKLGDLRVLLGLYAQAGEDFARAREAEMHPGGDVGRFAELWRKEGETWTHRRDYARALAAFAAAEDSAGPTGGLAIPTRVTLALNRAEIHLEHSEYEAVEAATVCALALLDAEQPDRFTDRERARAFLVRALVAFHRGDHVAMDASTRQSMALAERAGDQSLLAAGWKWLGLAALQRGDLTHAGECAQRGLTIAERSGDRGALWVAWSLLTRVSTERGEFARAEECIGRALELVQPMGDPAALAVIWVDQASVAWAQGRLAEAEEQFRRSAAVFDRVGDLFGSIVCGVYLGYVARDRGALPAAATWFRQARRLARTVNARWQALAATGLAGVHLRAGRVRRVAAALAQAEAAAGAESFLWYVLERELVTAELHLVHGEIAEATAVAQRALLGAAPAGRRPDAARARCLLGRCALAQSEYAAATSHLRAALEVQVEIGTALEAARTRMALAEGLVAGIGSGEILAEARMLLAAARAQFAASEAVLDLARADHLSTAWISC